MNSSSSKNSLIHMFSSLNVFKIPSLRHGDKKSHNSSSKSNAFSNAVPSKNKSKDPQKAIDRDSLRLPLHRSDEAGFSQANPSYPSQGNLAPSTTVGTLMSAESEAIQEIHSAHNTSRMDYEAPTDIDNELGYSASNILNYWREKETSDMKELQYDPSFAYVPHRRYMVDWLSEIGEDLRLLPVTVHVAIALLDKNCSKHEYDLKTWRLQAICCLSLAAKYEEAERNMPMVSEMGLAAEIRLTTSMVTNEEYQLAKSFGWVISAVTAMHFVGYYIHQGVTFRLDLCQGRVLVNKVTRYMKKYVEFFANLCQQDYSFLKYKPSVIAAASILAARRALCIEPLWRPELEKLTGYKTPDISSCMNEVWQFYESMFPTHQPLRTSNDPSRSSGKK